MDQQALTSGIIINHIAKTLDRKEIKKYSGDFNSNEPTEVLESVKYTFEHEGPPPKGSMAGVAYNASGHQWVLAWSVPPPDQYGVNGVYVEDGPDAQIDWEVIEKKLESAGDTCVSPGAVAVIRPTDGGVAQLTAVFMDPRP